jgi:hypothetical protein
VLVGARRSCLSYSLIVEVKVRAAHHFRKAENDVKDYVAKVSQIRGGLLMNVFDPEAL